MQSLALLLSFILPLVASGEDRGYCYSSLQKRTIQEPAGFYNPPLDSQARDIRHWSALRASMDIYNLPDLENSTKGDEFISKFDAFIASPVPGYQFWDFEANRQTGLKYAILSPLDPINPWIFVFSGTQTSMDWAADLDLGRRQVQKVEDMVNVLVDCLTIDNEGNPLASKNWLITGHSLGGGLAEIFAFKLASRRMLGRMTPGKIELVTFNGFGALDLVTPDPASVDLVVPTMLTSNYFVAGDVVSRIGTHLGNTYELQPNFDVNPISAHSLSTIESIVMNGDYVDFSGAVAVAPPYSGVLNSLKSVGSVFGFVIENPDERLWKRLEQLTLLEQAANIVIRRGLSHTTDYSALRYIKNIAISFKEQIQSEPSSELRQEMIDDLEALIRAISSYQN